MGFCIVYELYYRLLCTPKYWRKFKPNTLSEDNRKNQKFPLWKTTNEKFPYEIQDKNKVTKEKQRLSFKLTAGETIIQ